VKSLLSWYSILTNNNTLQPVYLEMTYFETITRIISACSNYKIYATSSMTEEIFIYNSCAVSKILQLL